MTRYQRASKRPRLSRDGDAWTRRREGAAVQPGAAAMADGWAGLPPELLGRVLAVATEQMSLPPAALLAIRFTCRDWYTAHSEFVNRLAVPSMRDRDLGSIAGLRRLQHLKLQLCLLNPVRSESLDACFTALTHLRCLTISNVWHGTGPRVMGAIGCTPSLHHLTLGSPDCRGGGAGEVPDAALRSLSRLTQLRSFECHSILRLTGSAFRVLQRSWSLTLRDLCLVGGHHLTDAALEGIGHMTALESLRLEDCSAGGTRGGRFTDAGLAQLASCTRLRELTFVYNGDRVGLTDEGTAALAAGLRSLRRLNMSWHRNLGDTAAGALAAMTALTHLDLGYCDKVTSAVWDTLEPLKDRLQELRLTRLCPECGDWHAYLPDWWCQRHGHWQQDLPIGAWAYYDDWAV